MRHRRYICLYAPAVVVIVWAGVFALAGRGDTTVIFGCILFGFSMAFFAHQLIDDLRRRDRRNGLKERHP